MKNRLKQGALALISLFLITACAPQEDTEYSLGTASTAEQLAFTAIPTVEKPNVIALKNESKVPGMATWDLGNGSIVKGQTAKAEYPFAGDYVITLTLYTAGGSTSTTQEIKIANDDMSLLDTPMYRALTGGASNLAGKTWVFDQYHSGHFALGATSSGSPDWWSCPSNGKLGCSLYSQEFTFTQIGVKFEWKNNGYIYTNASGLEALGITDVVENPGGNGDFDVKYTPKGNYTFNLNETAKTITLNNDAFFGHYTGASTFKIISLTEDEFYIRCTSVVEGDQSWWYRFIPKEENIKPTIPLKGIPLTDDFEGGTLAIGFVREEMGTRDFLYNNPAPVPVNTSKMVYLYERSNTFYSNISYTVDAYKFDLTKVNKIRMKVFIPSYNDYNAETAVAGDWIAVNKLQKQVAVKLQNNELGGNAYTTQVEKVKANLTTDKWLELEFDFSDVANRQDFDKIILQFGAEGHSAPGIFFFDDFSFDQ